MACLELLVLKVIEDHLVFQDYLVTPDCLDSTAAKVILA